MQSLPSAILKYFTAFNNPRPYQVSGAFANLGKSLKTSFLVNTTYFMAFRSNENCSVNLIQHYNLYDNVLLQYCNINPDNVDFICKLITNCNNLKGFYIKDSIIENNFVAVTVLGALKQISCLTQLDLSNNNLSQEVADDIVSVIRVNNLLEILLLNDNHLVSSTVSVVNALKELSTLEEVNLNGNKNKSSDLAPAIASMIESNKRIEVLSLSDNNLKGNGIILIAKSLCKISALKVVNLQNNNITEEAAEALASIISNNIGLEELYLGNNQLKYGAIKIAQALQKISLLRVLDLQNNNIPEEIIDDLVAAINANKSIETLWLNDNHLGSSAVAVIQALKEISPLNWLNLSNNKNESNSLAPAMASMVENKFMEVLLLSDCNLNENGIIQMARSLCKISTLRVINLQNNNITEGAADALASIISSNVGLEELYLANNQLELGVIKLARAVQNVSSLRVLDLDSNNMSERVVDELSAAISANKLLERLGLSNNNLGSSMAAIAKLCVSISTLKQLTILNTNISVKEAHHLKTVIENNVSIESLVLSDNNFRSAGFLNILQALQTVSSLKYLYAYGINITATISEQFTSVISNNLLLRGLLLGDNFLKNSLLQITETCSRLTNLKLLELSHNCTSPTKVIDLASNVNKIKSLELLLFGGITLNSNENVYLNACNIDDKIANKRTVDTLRSENNFCSNKITCSELLRMQTQQVSSFNYDHLNCVYHHWHVYISYQHTDKYDQTMWSDIDYEFIVQEAKQKLSQIDSKAMISSLQIIRTLKAINLENNNINEDAATELAGHLCCNNILEQLWLRGNELYDKGALVVLQSLHNLSTLLILDLSFNHLSSESADGIVVVIGNNCSLQQLWLDGNDLLTRGVVIIASALKKLSSLRILSLCSNEITDDAAEEISNVITSNVLLVDLLLGNNQLEITGICRIAIALRLRKLFTLRKLDLSNNHITLDAAEELAVTLSNCTNLQQLFLNDNVLGTEGTIKIANSLKCIKTLQVLTLNNNGVTESAADAIVDVLKTNISLKIVLIGENDLQTTGINLIVQTAKNITTLQLLDVSDNHVSEDEKENFKAVFANNFTIVI